MNEYMYISNPYELMDFLDNNITYGYIDINNHIHSNELKGVKDLYIVRSIEDTIKSGLGTCIEQGKIIADVLKRLGYTPYIYCSFSSELDDLVYENSIKLHSFIIGEKNNKYLYFEHSNPMLKGMYEFDSIDEALDMIQSKYEGTPSYTIYQTGDIPVGMSLNEVIEYIQSFDVLRTNKHLK